MKLGRRCYQHPGPWPSLRKSESMNQSTASLRKVRVVFETRKGDFRSRYLDITEPPGDSAQTLMTRTSAAYRRRYGINQRIVVIHLS